MVSWLLCYELFQIRDLFSAFRNELLLTACNFRASNFSHRSSPAAVFKTPPKSRHHKSWIWRLLFIAIIHILHQKIYSMILFRILCLGHAVKEPSRIQRRSPLRGVSRLQGLHPRQQPIKFSLRQCSKGASLVKTGQAFSSQFSWF